MRMNLVQKAVKKGKLVICYMRKKEMKVDSLTKALGGMGYQEFVAAVLGKKVLNESTIECWDMKHGAGHGARHARGSALGDCKIKSW
jgi:hypothetical protein